MNTIRRIILAASLLAAFASSAIAQAPPAVPALPDTERRTSYSITGTTCACNVGFALYGSGNDVDSWLQVWVNGVQKLSTDATYGWSLSSATGPLLTIPRPITDAVLTFNSAQTATIQIVGARRPRRLSQFNENRGVAARDLNQAITDIIAAQREIWDKTSDLSGRGLFFAPGNTTGPMPQPSGCKNTFLQFDGTGLNPLCQQLVPAGNISLPGSSVDSDLVLWSGTGGNTLKDGGSLASALASPTAIGSTTPSTGKFTSLTDTGIASGTQCVQANSSGALSGTGLPCNGLSQNAITTTYSAQSSDCFNSIVAAGGSFYTISVGAASGFASNCVLKIVNNDPMPTGSNSTGAKIISLNGGASCSPGQSVSYLWPQQSIEITNISSSWTITRCPGLWEAPGGNFTLSINPSSGSDTFGVADGLAGSARAFASANGCLNFLSDQMQGNFLLATNFICTYAPSATDSTSIHWPPHAGPVGAQGRAGVQLNCNGGTLSGSMSLFFSGARLQVTGCTFTSTISLTEGAELIFGATDTLTPVSGQNIIQCASGSSVFNQGSTLNVAAGTGLTLINASACQANFPAINQTGNVTFTDVIKAQAAGYIIMGTWTTNGHTTTGVAFSLIECGVAEGTTNITGAGFSAGSASCTQNN